MKPIILCFLSFYLNHFESLFSEFRNRVENEFPELTKYYNVVSGLYLKAVPKQWRDQILDVKGDDSSSSTEPQKTVGNVSNTTSPTIASAAATAAAAITASAKTTQPQPQSQSNPTPKK